MSDALYFYEKINRVKCNATTTMMIVNNYTLLYYTIRECSRSNRSAAKRSNGTQRVGFPHSSQSSAAAVPNYIIIFRAIHAHIILYMAGNNNNMILLSFFFFYPPCALQVAYYYNMIMSQWEYIIVQFIYFLYEKL